MRIVVCALSDDGGTNVVEKRPGTSITANNGEKVCVAEIRMYCTTRGSLKAHDVDEQLTGLPSVQVQ